MPKFVTKLENKAHYYLNLSTKSVNDTHSKLNLKQDMLYKRRIKFQTCY